MLKSFHGPGPLPVAVAPELPVDVAGVTWDGGPAARMQLIEFQESRPNLVTDKGTEIGGRFNQYPITETTDEGVVAVASRQDETFPDNVKAVVNCGNTFGPHGDASKLMEYTLRFKNYFQPTEGASESDLAIRGMRIGMRPCVFRSEISFKDDFTVKDLTLSTAEQRGAKGIADFPGDWTQDGRGREGDQRRNYGKAGEIHHEGRRLVCSLQHVDGQHTRDGGQRIFRHPRCQ